MNDAMSINVDGSPGLMGRVGQKLCAAKERANKAVCLLDARMRLLTAEPEKGAVTAEYAVVLVATSLPQRCRQSPETPVRRAG